MTETTTAADQPVWVPHGHPVRNFVLACLALAARAAALGGTRITRARVVTASGEGEGNHLTKRFTSTVEVRNEALAPARVVGAVGRNTYVEDFAAVRIDGGETVRITVRGRVLCDLAHAVGPEGVADPEVTLGLRVRAPLGLTRTIGSDGLSSSVTSLCDPPPEPN